MTLRIEPGLLAALRERAKREGRSVSAEVIRMIRKEVVPEPARRRRATSTMGMFAGFEAPPLADFKRFRHEVSAAAVRRIRRSKRSA